MSQQLTVKFSDAFTQFDGNGDFAAWIERFEVVSRLQKIADLTNLLPLFLTGGAFAVYKGLSDTVKAEYDAVKKALTAAFSPDCFQAYDELQAGSCGPANLLLCMRPSSGALFRLWRPPSQPLPLTNGSNALSSRGYRTS